MPQLHRPCRRARRRLFTSVESLAADRDRWDSILTKLKSQEMPPEDVVRPEAEINDLVTFLETEFARADAR